jgi:hypothetical protein
MSDRKGDPARLPGSRARVRALVVRLSRPALAALAAGGFVLLAALAMTRGGAPRVAALTGADVGSVAKFDVRATQEVYVPDEATTARLREEAERAAPLVYLGDPSLRERQVAVLRRAFALVREGFDRYDREVEKAREVGAAAAAEEGGAAPREAEAAAAARRAGTVPQDGPESRPGRTLPAALRRPIRDRLRRFLSEKAADFLRLVPVDKGTFHSLAQMRFSRPAEELAVRMLALALDGFVVRDKVKFLIDLSSRVLLRTTGSARLTPIEKVVNPADVLDLAGARSRVADAAGELAGNLEPALRQALVQVARALVRENLVFDEATTARNRKRVRDSVPAQYRHYPRGSILLRQGDVITAEHIRILQAMTPAALGPEPLRVFFGNAFFVALVGALAYLATRLRVVRRKPVARDYFFLAIAVLLLLFLTRLSVEVSEILHDRWTEVPLSAFLLAIPVSFGAMLVRLLLSAELAILFSFVSALLVGLLAGANLPFGAVTFVGGFAAALLAGRARQRAHLLRAGLWVGLLQLGAVLFLAIASGQGGFPVSEASLVEPPSQGLFALTFLLDLGAALFSGAFAGLLTAAVVPLVEATFGYTTDMKYLELANLENPLLKDLFLRAPGTYHHSVVAGSLAEAAAEAIGANPSLARVGAYYHDVGKGKCPHYFAENQRDENPHEKLAPHMSALILKSHVKDGVEILRQAKMPQPIVDICEQHLGTTLIEFFYEKARRQAAEDNLPEPEENDFRYPGPKAQFRESALVLLADSIEAAGRAIADPTEPRLSEMVRRIIRNKFIDGQLDECDLTLRDLNAIAKAMTRVLVAIHHTRPRYPSQTAADARAVPSEAAADAPIDLAEHRRREKR